MVVIDFKETKYFPELVIFADILSGIKNDGKKGALCSLLSISRRLFQLVLILVHFVSKDLNILDNL